MSVASGERGRVPFWAVMIGIDEYAATSIRNLRGCRNDVLAMRSFLLTNLHVPPDQIMMLLDQNATRVNIIGAIGSLLEHPGLQRDDQILIHFSGHGSLMRPPLMWNSGPYVQSLVPHDSGADGVYNIPDRTLGALLDALASKHGSNITVVLDACHSGSGTRNLEAEGAAHARRAAPDERLPPPDLDATLLTGSTARNAGASGWPTAGMPYVLLAGCRDVEQSYEYRPAAEGAESWNGALTYFTLQTLRELANVGPISYRDLHERVAAQVNTIYPLQMPQCEGEGRNRAIFGGLAMEREPWILVDQVSADKLTLRAGLLHGCGPGAVVHVYASNPALRTRTDLPATPLAIANVVSATATTSVARVVAGSGPVAPLARSVVAAPSYSARRQLVLVKVADVAAKPTAALLVAELQRLEVSGGLIQLQVDPDGPFDLCVMSEGAQLSIYGADGNLLVQPLPSTNQEEGARQVLRALQSIARFRALQALGNHEQLGDLTGKLRLQVRQYREVDGLASGEPLPYQADGDQLLVFDPAQPDTSRYVIDIINTSETPVFSSLFILNPDYSIVPLYPTLGQEQAIRRQGGVDGQISVGLGETRERPLRVWLPHGWESCRDYLKLIVTSRATDLQFLKQPALAVPPPSQLRSGYQSPLQELLENAISGTRFGDLYGTTAVEPWGTVSLTLTVVRQASRQELTSGSERVLLNDGLAMRKPSLFVGYVRQVPSLDLQRNAGGPPAPRSLEQSEMFLPFTIPGTRSVTQSALTLDLEFDEATRITVNDTEPLVIEVAGADSTTEMIVAVAFDGEDYLFVGSDEQSPGAVRIAWLPQPTEGASAASRGTLNTLRLFLYRKLGRHTDRIGLRRGLLQGRTVLYEPVSRDQFSRGQSVAVVIHGFNSDTQWMVRDVGPLLREQIHAYDHLLAFDYESFGTSIEQSAEQLAQSLRQTCGFGADDGIRVDMFAHSMGSIVARCAIELFGADNYVDRLVMAGPPNRGSTLASTGRAISYLATAALNEIGKIPPLGLLHWTLEEFQKQGVGMAGLEVDSELLRQINGLQEPSRTPYLILAGTYVPTADERRRLSRLAQKLLDRTADTLFGEDNDLVVGASCQVGLRGGAYQRLKIASFACDHFAYYYSSAVQDVLKMWMAETEQTP